MNGEGDVMGSRYRCRYRGKTLSEYAFVIAFVAIASIAALTFMGTSFSDMLMANNINQKGSGLFATLGPKADPTAAPTGDDTTMAALPNEPGAVTNGGTAGGTTTSGGSGTVTLTLASGLQIQIPDFPSDLTGIVDTAGANGATYVLASTLQQLAQQLLAAGAVTQAEANLLINLANQGFRIAQIEGDVETAVNAPGFEFGGNFQSSQVSQMANLIRGGGSLSPQSYNGMGTEMQQFAELYNQAAGTGMMSDPVINAVVTSLARQIGTSADGFSNTVQSFSVGSQDPNFFDMYVVSTFTQANSMGICSSGGGQTSGVSCSSS